MSQPRSTVWKELRQGDAKYTHAEIVSDRGVLIAALPLRHDVLDVQVGDETLFDGSPQVRVVKRSLPYTHEGIESIRLLLLPGPGVDADENRDGKQPDGNNNE